MEKCDRCRARADYKATRARKVLTFCAHCAQKSGKALRRDGWLFSPLRPHASAPQER